MMTRSVTCLLLEYLCQFAVKSPSLLLLLELKAVNSRKYSTRPALYHRELDLVFFTI